MLLLGLHLYALVFCPVLFKRTVHIPQLDFLALELCLDREEHVFLVLENLRYPLLLGSLALVFVLELVESPSQRVNLPVGHVFVHTAFLVECPGTSVGLEGVGIAILASRSEGLHYVFAWSGGVPFF